MEYTQNLIVLPPLLLWVLFFIFLSHVRHTQIRV